MDLQSQERVAELEAKIQQANHDYYNGSPNVSDVEYDSWRDELKGLKEDSPVLQAVGAPPASEWMKVKHLIPMGSLNKVQNPVEFTSWVKKYSRTSKESLVVLDKLDGISVSLRYEEGAFVQGLTRGDGLIGEDITSNVRRMKGVLQTLPNLEPLVIRGEIVLLKEDHRQHFPDKANPRNAASGTSKRLDGKGSEHLSVLVYQVEGLDTATEDQQMEALEALGFKVPYWSVHSDLSSVIREWERYQAGFRDALAYEIDGLVVRLNDRVYQESLGDVHGRPNGAVAFKFEAYGEETVAKEVVWQVGGTGRLTPVAVFDPVNLVGAEITRASLYNQAYIEELGFDVGATIFVVRANDVIPRVGRVVKPTGSVLTPPSNCPVCGHSVTQDGEYLVCGNSLGCSAQVVGRLKQWVTELNILEWGDTLLQKLVDERLASNVADLYRLTKPALASLDRMGDKSAEKALGTLWAATPMPLENFLGALSIPLCATSIIRLVIDAGYDTLERIQNASVEELQAIQGLGPKRALAIHGGLKQNSVLISDLLALGVAIKNRAVGPLTGKSVCFTGKSIRKRAELEQMAIEAGASVKGSVGKGLTYLVMSDPDSGSSKAVAARKNGTSCLSEEMFVKMCGGS